MKEGKTRPINELVNQVLRQMGLEQKFKEYEVRQLWPEVVGQMIASRTKVRSERRTAVCDFYLCCRA